MSNIRQVQWNDEAPKKVQRGMVFDYCSTLWLVGDGKLPRIEITKIKRWAWLIQPHELNWLEDMASRKTRTQE